MRFFCIVLFLVGISHAFYADAGFSQSFFATYSNGKSLKDRMDKYSETGFILSLRIGEQITQKLIISGEYERLFHAFDSEKGDVEINRYLFGPSLIFYPVNHFQLSGTVGYTWTDFDKNYLKLKEGDGVGFSVTASYDLTNSGPSVLFGSKISYFTDSEDLNTFGVSLFIRILIKD